MSISSGRRPFSFKNTGITFWDIDNFYKAILKFDSKLLTYVELNDNIYTTLYVTGAQECYYKLVLLFNFALVVLLIALISKGNNVQK